MSTPPPKMPPNMRVCQSFRNSTSWHGNRLSSEGTAEALCPCTVRSWLAGPLRQKSRGDTATGGRVKGAAAGKAESTGSGDALPPHLLPLSPAESQARTCWYWERETQLRGAARRPEPVSVRCGRLARGSPRLEKILRETKTNTVDRKSVV